MMPVENRLTLTDSRPVPQPSSTGSLESILHQYSQKPELLELILLSKVQEDRRRAEEAKLRSKEIDYVLQKEHTQPTPSNRHQHRHSLPSLPSIMDPKLDSPSLTNSSFGSPQSVPEPDRYYHRESSTDKQGLPREKRPLQQPLQLQQRYGFSPSSPPPLPAPLSLPPPPPQQQQQQQQPPLFPQRESPQNQHPHSTVSHTMVSLQQQQQHQRRSSLMLPSLMDGRLPSGTLEKSQEQQQPPPPPSTPLAALSPNRKRPSLGNEDNTLHAIHPPASMKNTAMFHYYYETSLLPTNNSNKLPIPPMYSNMAVHASRNSNNRLTNDSSSSTHHGKRRRREMQAITMVIETREFPYNDDYLWKNNGNTVHKGSGNRSIYYKCANNPKGCPVNKTVTFKDNGEYLIKYRGKHLDNCSRIKRVVDI